MRDYTWYYHLKGDPPGRISNVVAKDAKAAKKLIKKKNPGREINAFSCKD